MYRHKRKYIVFIIIIFITLAVNLVFRLVYVLDNKYTSAAPRGNKGQLVLSAKNLDSHPVIPAIDGWEFYIDSAYTPKDFATGITTLPKYIFLGEYANYSLNEKERSPFGIATYRLIIRSEKPLTMELPEVFSACQVWINGTSVLKKGSIHPYRPQIQNTLLSIPAGRAELVIQAANYSHYYSGITYPPMLGRPVDISRMLSIRQCFYGILCFFTLGTSIAFLSVWLLQRQEKRYLIYGLLTLSFAVHTSYPFLHWLGIGAPSLLYVIEDTAWFVMVFFMLRLTALSTESKVTSKFSYFLRRMVLAMGLFLCFLPVLCTILVFPMVPTAVHLYGTLIRASKLLFGLYLMGTALATSLYGGSLWLLAGNAVFGLGILTDQITAGLFEPIYLGWQTEYSGFFMVLIFLVMMVRQTGQIIAENLRYTQHLSEEVDEKTKHLRTLLFERKQFLSSVAHDLKAPVSIIRTYTDLIQLGNVEVDQETADYLSAIETKAVQMQTQLQSLQQFNLEDVDDEPLTTIVLNTFLLDIYTENKPYAVAIGIYFHLDLCRKEIKLNCRVSRLRRALENIILNATEYTPPEGSITLSSETDGKEVILRIADTGCGIPPENLPHIFDYRFSTSQAEFDGEVRGLGLYFAKLTVTELGGEIFASPRPGGGTLFTIRLPLL